MTTAVLVDARNIDQLAAQICEEVSRASLIGLDIETDNREAHEGIKAITNKTVFDINRTVLCGLSLYPDGGERAYYFNLGHADIHNRVSWERIRPILDSRRTTAYWVIHNAPFERVMLRHTVGYEVENFICTLQLAVSAYGPDEYDINRFATEPLNGMAKLVPEISRVFVTYDRQHETAAQSDIFAKVTAKEAHSEQSYNGWVDGLAYGYGLKKAVRSFFDYEMTTYEEVLGGREGMADLTGSEVLAYGADDAVWCVRLYYALLDYVLRTNPDVLLTFFEQELPMVSVYADCQSAGVRIDYQAVARQQGVLRAEFAVLLRRLKVAVKQLLPFPASPHPKLFDREPWYRKNWQKYRLEIEEWAALSCPANDFQMACQVRSSVSNAWSMEVTGSEPRGVNLVHYMPMRILLYDLPRRESLIMANGKVQSDGEARGKLLATASGVEKEVLDCLREMATIEQAMKLFITPYLKLIDPDSGRVHPSLSSMLATRRMAMSNPNSMQLAKRGQTVYVRGFFLGDDEDHVMVSVDWSQIELVMIGDQSGDPTFLECYASDPYQDLHEHAVSGVMEVDIEVLRSMKRGNSDVPAHLLVDPAGNPLTPEKAYKYWRTEVGKGSNFEYWYSGYLSNVSQTLGWSRETQWEKVERYRQRFPVAEQWRVETINECRRNGFVTLPDKHRRVRFEATPQWAEMWRYKWLRYGTQGAANFAQATIQRIQTRAGNQAVNAKIQGSCAALAKRSILRINAWFKEQGWGSHEARFMWPIHDELVFSIRKNLVVEAILGIKRIMCNHPDLISKVRIDASPSIGLTFKPWTPKSPLGQIELYEAPAIPVVPDHLVGKKLPVELWPAVIEHLFETRRRTFRDAA